jgi:cold shock CspA family protein
MERRMGIIRKLVEDRGFGFLKVLEKREDGKPARVDKEFPQDVFLHYFQLKKSGIAQVAVGDVLEFNITQNDKGLNATRVSRVQ